MAQHNQKQASNRRVKFPAGRNNSEQDFAKYETCVTTFIDVKSVMIYAIQRGLVDGPTLKQLATDVSARTRLREDTKKNTPKQDKTPKAKEAKPATDKSADKQKSPQPVLTGLHKYEAYVAKEHVGASYTLSLRNCTSWKEAIAHLEREQPDSSVEAMRAYALQHGYCDPDGKALYKKQEDKGIDPFYLALYTALDLTEKEINAARQWFPALGRKMKKQVTENQDSKKDQSQEEGPDKSATLPQPADSSGKPRGAGRGAPRGVPN